MSIVRKYIFVFACTLFTAHAWGQAAQSPFSNFGIGEHYGNGLTNNQGMGGTGVAQPQYWFLNNTNPALLVFNTLTTFEAGGMVDKKTIRSNTGKDQSVGGNMNYLATAFPIKVTKWTTAIGLMPITTVNYKIAYIGDIDGSPNKVDVEEQGSGGLSQLYWSNGVRITEDFAVGLKASYVFSSILNTYKNKLRNNSNPVNYFSTIEQKTYVQDFTLTPGISFSKDSVGRKLYRVSVGAVYEFGTNLKATRTDRLYRSTAIGDTLDGIEISKIRGSLYIPPSLTFGVSISKSVKWALAAEASFQNWSKFRSVNADDEGLGQAWRYGLGAEITPDAGAVDNFFKRITYRAGGSMEQYPFLANGKTVKDLGINFGLSVPAGRSNVNLAVKFGKRGDKAENILEENYFKLYFGITFNDQWFIKRRFD